MPRNPQALASSGATRDPSNRHPSQSTHHRLLSATTVEIPRDNATPRPGNGNPGIGPIVGITSTELRHMMINIVNTAMDAREAA